MDPISNILLYLTCKDGGAQYHGFYNYKQCVGCLQHEMNYAFVFGLICFTFFLCKTTFITYIMKRLLPIPKTTFNNNILKAVFTILLVDQVTCSGNLRLIHSTYEAIIYGIILLVLKYLKK